MGKNPEISLEEFVDWYYGGGDPETARIIEAAIQDPASELSYMMWTCDNSHPSHIGDLVMKIVNDPIQFDDNSTRTDIGVGQVAGRFAEPSEEGASSDDQGESASHYQESVAPNMLLGSTPPNDDQVSELAFPSPQTQDFTTVEPQIQGGGRESDSREGRTEPSILPIVAVKPNSATRRPKGVSPDEYGSDRRSWGLIETLVLIASAAVLLAMLLPIGISAREAARRAQCTNNLKQIGLATAIFESTHSHLPPGIGPFPWYSGGGARSSVPAQLLPYLEFSHVYAAFNFGIDLDVVGPTAVNHTAQTQLVSAFICPSDPSTGRLLLGGSKLGYSNYFASTGNTASLQIGTAAYQATSVSRLGVFNYSLDTSQPRYLDAPTNTQLNPNYNRAVPVRIAQITDGTSSTAAFAETRRSRAVANTAPEIPISDLLNVYTITGDFSGIDSILPPPGCSTFANQIRVRFRGQQYYRSLPWTGYYSHTVPPNYNLWDCTNSPNFNQGHTAARSYHPGGVNVGFCDGSVRFISNTVGDTIWRSIGTRSGGEVFSSDAF